MLQKFIIFIIILTAVLFQVSVLPNFFSPGTVPELALILIIIWTVNNGFESTLWRTITAGLLLDLFYFWPIGVNIFAAMVISYATDYLSGRFVIAQKTRKLLFLAAAVAGAAIVNAAWLNIIGLVFKLSVREPGFMIVRFWDARLLLKIIIDIALLVVIYWPIRTLENFLSLYSPSSYGQKKVFQRR